MDQYEQQSMASNCGNGMEEKEKKKMNNPWNLELFLTHWNSDANI